MSKFVALCGMFLLLFAAMADAGHAACGMDVHDGQATHAQEHGDAGDDSSCRDCCGVTHCHHAHVMVRDMAFSGVVSGYQTYDARSHSALISQQSYPPSRPPKA